ncbi:hypothetical protein TRVL_07532 [Trypanosoma vivax]|nr:hypothetical protein TRVL_07532 [Trypanosoma vivax]
MIVNLIFRPGPRKWVQNNKSFHLQVKRYFLFCLRGRERYTKRKLVDVSNIKAELFSRNFNDVKYCECLKVIELGMRCQIFRVNVDWCKLTTCTCNDGNSDTTMKANKKTELLIFQSV